MNVWIWHGVAVDVYDGTVNSNKNTRRKTYLMKEFHSKQLQSGCLSGNAFITEKERQLLKEGKYEELRRMQLAEEMRAKSEAPRQKQSVLFDVVERPWVKQKLLQKSLRKFVHSRPLQKPVTLKQLASQEALVRTEEESRFKQERLVLFGNDEDNDSFNSPHEQDLSRHKNKLMGSKYGNGDRIVSASQATVSLHAVVAKDVNEQLIDQQSIYHEKDGNCLNSEDRLKDDEDLDSCSMSKDAAQHLSDQVESEANSTDQPKDSNNEWPEEFTSALSDETYNEPKSIEDSGNCTLTTVDLNHDEGAFSNKNRSNGLEIIVEDL
ncbi:uncharacterized protein LOC134844678 isoform X2 [Symsagittifera roscoffensis]|uniref:uncharacterized protein LOC134844678 isoform X2 n=2 Tax=Symsagittifera roscoffensis TaxID=84072 RepID=UPI00307B7F5E